jgi:hypothetical protein
MGDVKKKRCDSTHSNDSTEITDSTGSVDNTDCIDATVCSDVCSDSTAAVSYCCKLYTAYGLRSDIEKKKGWTRTTHPHQQVCYRVDAI